MKNTLTDLNNLLFEEMEKLRDSSLTGEELTQEINRAKAMSVVAEKIIEGGNLVLKAQEVMAEHHSSKLVEVPSYLLCESEKT